MSKPNDGGPFHPTGIIIRLSGTEIGHEIEPGASYRKWLVGTVDVPWSWVEKLCAAMKIAEPSVEQVAGIIAKVRVILADEIIAELEKESA